MEGTQTQNQHSEVDELTALLALVGQSVTADLDIETDAAEDISSVDELTALLAGVL